MTDDRLLEIRDLAVEFRTGSEIVKAVNGVSFSVNRGETLAILGESGSGKTVSALAIMKLLPTPPAVIKAEAIYFDGNDLLKISREMWKQFTGERMSMIFQDALPALNPVFSVGWQISEVFKVHRRMDKKEARSRTLDLLTGVGIPEPSQRAREYPHQFSGGMRQRAMIAMAIALKPDLLIADEPTTALDVTVQAQIMDLLEELRKERGMALILITHDIGVVAETADRVAVMYAGRIVETGAIQDVLGHPAHPYTQGLLHSMPQAQRREESLKPILGSPPNLAHIPSGCAFHPRCTQAEDACRRRSPTLEQVGPEHFAECYRIGSGNND